MHRNSVHRAARQGRLPARQGRQGVEVPGRGRRRPLDAGQPRLRGPAEPALSGPAFPSRRSSCRPWRRPSSCASSRTRSTTRPPPSRLPAWKEGQEWRTSASALREYLSADPDPSGRYVRNGGTREAVGASVVRRRQPPPLASSEHYRVKAAEQTLQVLAALEAEPELTLPESASGSAPRPRTPTSSSSTWWSRWASSRPVRLPSAIAWPPGVAPAPSARALGRAQPLGGASPPGGSGPQRVDRHAGADRGALGRCGPIYVEQFRGPRPSRSRARLPRPRDRPRQGDSRLPARRLRARWCSPS